MDFARIIETFEKHKVSFVAVTQQFNTATSMGRLVLNVLLSFAQFEREMISERTRDKIAATRRKGRWSGGVPILGYSVVDKKLVVDPTEAEQVRQIFELYVEHQSLLDTANELNRRGWSTKRWTTKKGKPVGGFAFNKTNLHFLLTNVLYVGKVRYKDEVHAGLHEAIVDADLFDRVQQLLAHNGCSGGRDVRNKYGALLKGLLRCTACDCAMSHSYASKGNRRYRYYVCVNAQKRGWKSCPAPSVPAGEMERFVVDQIKAIGRDPAVVAATFGETGRLAEEAIKEPTGGTGTPTSPTAPRRGGHPGTRGPGDGDQRRAGQAGRPAGTGAAGRGTPGGDRPGIGHPGRTVHFRSRGRREVWPPSSPCGSPCRRGSNRGSFTCSSNAWTSTASAGTRPLRSIRRGFGRSPRVRQEAVA